MLLLLSFISTLSCKAIMPRGTMSMLLYNHWVCFYIIVMLLYNHWVCYYIYFVFCAIICGLLGVVFAYYSCIAMGCYGPGFLHPNHHTQHLQNIGQTMDMQLGAPCKPTMDMCATRKCKLIYFGHFMQACNSFSSWNRRHA